MAATQSNAIPTSQADDEELREFRKALQTPSVQQQLRQSEEDFRHGRYRSLEEYLKKIRALKTEAAAT